MPHSRRSPLLQLVVVRRPTVLIFGVLLLTALVVLWTTHRPTPVTYLTAAVTRGAVTRTVVATGTVNPQLTIIVGSYVSGVISNVYCDYNTRVNQGQLCAKIDPRPYQAALDQAQGQLARDSAQLAGARRLHVLLQFLTEAIFLSVSGGIGGIAAGVAASALISAVAHWPTLLSPAAISGGFMFSAAVGILFGYYPARKAAHLNPIEALRYE